jgi:hypothetical protein
MVELPLLDRRTLSNYLRYREDFLQVVYVDMVQMWPSRASQAGLEPMLAMVWLRVRELHRARLAFLGIPAPSMRDWVTQVVTEAEANPEAWALKRCLVVEKSFELSTDRDEIPAEPVDRVTATYRALLSAEH